MPTYLTIILSILLGGIGGAISGAVLSHYLNRSQRKKEKIYTVTVEAYCEKLLEPLSNSLSQTYNHMRMLGYEERNDFKIEYKKYFERMENITNLGRLSIFPDEFKHVPSIARILLESYYKLRRLQRLQIHTTPEDIKERVDTAANMVEEMVNAINSTSDRIRMIKIPNELEEIPEKIKTDEIIIRINEQLEDIRKRAVGFSNEKVLSIK